MGLFHDGIIMCLPVCSIPELSYDLQNAALMLEDFSIYNKDDDTVNKSDLYSLQASHGLKKFSSQPLLTPNPNTLIL